MVTIGSLKFSKRLGEEHDGDYKCKTASLSLKNSGTVTRDVFDLHNFYKSSSSAMGNKSREKKIDVLIG